MSTRLSAAVVLHPLVLPARADAGDAASLSEFARIRNQALAETSGRDDEHLTPAELLPTLRSDPDSLRAQWTVVADGRPVGVAALNVPADDGGRTGFVSIDLLREVHGRGIGTTALRTLEQHAAAEGVRRLLTWVEHPDSGEPRRDAPTGFGSIPLTHSAHFLLRRGFVLEQVERISVFDLQGADIDDLVRRRDDAARHAQDYRVVTWTLPTPREFADGYALLKQSMSTDVPDADLDMPTETWDAERIRRHDQRYLDRGFTVQVTDAQHVRTGELCAFNELSIRTDAGAMTHQEDTLVLAAHRGHRLGMLVKAAGLLDWRERRPDSPSVLTYNAEENRPMLSINEAIGFTPAAYVGAWKKELT